MIMVHAVNVVLCCTEYYILKNTLYYTWDQKTSVKKWRTQNKIINLKHSWCKFSENDHHCLEYLEIKTLYSKNKLKIPTDVIKLKSPSKGNNIPLVLIWHCTIKMYRGGVLTLALDCAKLLVSYPDKFNFWFHLDKRSSGSQN